MRNSEANAMEKFMDCLKNNPEFACDFIRWNYCDISQEDLAIIIEEMFILVEFICKDKFKDAAQEIAIAIRNDLDEREAEDAFNEEMKMLNEKIIAECIKRMEERYGEDWEKQPRSVKQEIYGEVLTEIKVE